MLWECRAGFGEVEKDSSDKLIYKLHLKTFYQGMNGKDISVCANMFNMNKDGVFGKLQQSD